jgi:hypothetical protein
MIGERPMLMSQSPRVHALLLLILLSAVPSAFAQSGRVRSGPGTGDPYENLVPWRFLDKGGALINAPLVLYWLTATQQEAEQSPLLSSKELILASDRCVSFEIVLPEDAVTIAKFGEAGKLPAALLTDAKGNVIRRRWRRWFGMSWAPEARRCTPESPRPRNGSPAEIRKGLSISTGSCGTSAASFRWPARRRNTR